MAKKNTEPSPSEVDEAAPAPASRHQVTTQGSLRSCPSGDHRQHVPHRAHRRRSARLWASTGARSRWPNAAAMLIRSVCSYRKLRDIHSFWNCYCCKGKNNFLQSYFNCRNHSINFLTDGETISWWFPVTFTISQSLPAFRAARARGILTSLPSSPSNNRSGHRILFTNAIGLVKQFSSVLCKNGSADFWKAIAERHKVKIIRTSQGDSALNRKNSTIVSVGWDSNPYFETTPVNLSLDFNHEKSTPTVGHGFRPGRYWFLIRTERLQLRIILINYVRFFINQLLVFYKCLYGGLLPIC